MINELLVTLLATDENKEKVRAREIARVNDLYGEGYSQEEIERRLDCEDVESKDASSSTLRKKFREEQYRKLFFQKKEIEE